MGSKFYRLKIGLYIFVILVVMTLFAVRVHNALQKTNYSRNVIFYNGDIEISLHYPTKIFSPKIDVDYPLVLSLYYTGDIKSAHTYEIFLQSPTLLFVDANRANLIPRFQFTSGQSLYEQSIYVHPYPSENHTQKHFIFISVLIDGKPAPIQPQPIVIRVEPLWFSFLSLAAMSFLEISILGVLVTWVVNTIDATWTAQKERVAKIRDALKHLPSLPPFEQMDKVCKLENETRDEHLDDDVREEIQNFKRQFTEEEFFRALGNKLRQDTLPSFSEVQKLYGYFCPSKTHFKSLEALEKILNHSISQETVSSDLENLLQLWDALDVDAKDLIIGALTILQRQINLAAIPALQLENTTFKSSIIDKPYNRRRLLRDTEIQQIFPQLVNVNPAKPRPPDYKIPSEWLLEPKSLDDPRILNWLKREFPIVSNPFGIRNLKTCLFYPEGFARPDKWTDFLSSTPQLAQCVTAEDAKALSYHLRAECFPKQKVFPVMASFNRLPTIESALLTITHSTAQTWLEILSLSPDALLDLPLEEEEAVLELLCWTFSSASIVTSLLDRARSKGAADKTDRSRNLLIQKIKQFKNRFPSTQVPQDAILLSWLKIRPPDLNLSYLIILIDGIPTTAKEWWLEQLSPLIPTLFLHGVVTKALSSLHIPCALPLSDVQLDWSDKNLKLSLYSQFEAAMDKKRCREEQMVDFRSLFGSNPSIGYLESEENTTDKLIAASRNSLARMCILGNRLLQYHCEKRGVLDKYLHVEDLETILNSA